MTLNHTETGFSAGAAAGAGSAAAGRATAVGAVAMSCETASIHANKQTCDCVALLKHRDTAGEDIAHTDSLRLFGRLELLLRVSM